MLKVIQFRYGNDNLGYLIHDEHTGIAIDPGDPGFLWDYIQQHGIHLKGIWNTHSHSDHTLGDSLLAAKSGARIMRSTGTEYITLEGGEIEVMPTPGHTQDSVCFRGNGWVITGDTLLIANVGNSVPGLFKAFRGSLTRLISLPEETVVYPGHDYTARSILRAMQIEPGNDHIKRFWQSYTPPPVVSTIGDEKRINPYLRTEVPAVIAYLKANGKNTDTSFKRFKSFLEL